MWMMDEFGHVIVHCHYFLQHSALKWIYFPIPIHYNTTFTHLCACLTSPLARTFVCLCLCAKELFSHAYEHSHVRTHNANRHLSPLTRVWKTASRASATNGKANDAMNDDANMWLIRSSFASPLARMCKCGIIFQKWQSLEPLTLPLGEMETYVHCVFVGNLILDIFL